MSEFINEFGKENFIILIAIVGAIVLALIIIIAIEKIQAKSKLKKQIEHELASINSRKEPEKKIAPPEKEIVVKEKLQPEKESVEVLEEPIEEYEEVIPVKEEPEAEVYYVESKDPEAEAKEKLEKVTKRLIEEQNDLIDHTHFETEQEEKSIISYEELVKASHDIDEKNDKLLADEDEAAITLEELYQKHVDEQNIIEEEKSEIEVKVNNPVFEDEEPKKFKNSEVISPVFGFYKNPNTTKPKQVREAFKKMDEGVGMNELEDEIKKTEDFLSELKRLKNKLD